MAASRWERRETFSSLAARLANCNAGRTVDFGNAVLNCERHSRLLGHSRVPRGVRDERNATKLSTRPLNAERNATRGTTSERNSGIRNATTPALSLRSTWGRNATSGYATERNTRGTRELGGRDSTRHAQSKTDCTRFCSIPAGKNAPKSGDNSANRSRTDEHTWRTPDADLPSRFAACERSNSDLRTLPCASAQDETNRTLTRLEPSGSVLFSLRSGQVPINSRNWVTPRSKSGRLWKTA